MQKGRKSPSGAAYSMKFVAGPAEEILARLSFDKGISKNEVLCQLIAGARIYGGDDYRAEYRRLTGIGKSLAKERDFPMITGIAEYALDIIVEASKRLWPEISELGRENLDKRQMGVVQDGTGAGMTFRPKEQKAKLFTLSYMAGISKPAVLRALLLGIRLPNTQALKTWGRAAQIGALCKHLALKARQGGWKHLYDIGVKIQGMALEGTKLEKERRRLIHAHVNRQED